MTHYVKARLKWGVYSVYLTWESVWALSNAVKESNEKTLCLLLAEKFCDLKKKAREARQGTEGRLHIEGVQDDMTIRKTIFWYA